MSEGRGQLRKFLREKAGWIVGTLLVLGFAGWVVIGSETFQACIESESPQYEDAALYKRVALVQITPRAFISCLGDFFKEDGEAIMALFTIILAISTIGLWIKTDRLAKGAEETAERQLRAYIGVESVAFEAPDLRLGDYAPQDRNSVGVPCRNFACVTIRNFGQTPALSVQTFIYLATTGFATRLPIEFLRANDADVVDAEDTRETRDIPMLQRSQPYKARLAVWDLTDVRRAHLKTATLYIFGRTYYRDAFDRPRRTTFCYVWNPDQDGSAYEFSPYEEYNGEDQKPAPVPQESRAHGAPPNST